MPAPGEPVKLTVTEFYRKVARARGFLPDTSQEAALARLQRLYDQFIAYKARRKTRIERLLVHPPLPTGVYFWGGVGRGKSFLMDAFYTCVPVVRKTRVHFHPFMREVHRQLEHHRGEADPLVSVAKALSRKHRLICFDEFHVSDIADAMILGRLLEELVARRVVFCMTSNYRPEGLYPNGLQRERFLPAVDLIRHSLEIVNVDGGVDYRLRSLEKFAAYHFPLDERAERQLAEAFEEIAEGADVSARLRVNERELCARRCGPGVAWFGFDTLCGGPRSQNDYLELARSFHTLLLSGIPRMSAAQASEARRFTWLVDILYDHKVKLLASAEVSPENLYTEGLNSQEFARTVSRLQEMQTRAYLSLAHLS
ncbi:MAG: cell division protein ZapE [Betaproteobacteria bacterium]|nr:cell division protein ZapE [Betaproteobacteria bacterium]